MIDQCKRCAEIQGRRVDLTAQRTGRSGWRVQCEGCGVWHHLNWQRRPSPDGFFCRYIPIECTQRRCQAHATHKVKARGKRRYKCAKHAGVCIIA